MSLIRIDHNVSRRQLTVFGVCWLLFFGALGGMASGRGGSPAAAAALWTAALAVPAVGWMAPGGLRLVYLGMAYAAFPIGLVVSHAVLAAVYYLVLTPIGLCLRLSRYDPMRRRFNPRAESYWLEHKSEEDVSRYFRQF